MILRCRLCHAPIAAFDPARLNLPPQSAAFEPLETGFPPPFPPDDPWDTVRCPHCRHHPQGYDPDGRDSLDTDQGLFPLPRPKAPVPAAQTKPREKNAKRGN